MVPLLRAFWLCFVHFCVGLKFWCSFRPSQLSHILVCHLVLSCIYVSSDNLREMHVKSIVLVVLWISFIEKRKIIDFFFAWVQLVQCTNKYRNTVDTSCSNDDLPVGVLEIKKNGLFFLSNGKIVKNGGRWLIRHSCELEFVITDKPFDLIGKT